MNLFNKYLNDGKAKDFSNVFYVVQCPYVSHEWWQLLLVETHQVISTSPTKAGILQNVEMMVKKYKNADTILEVMKKTDYQINPITLEQRKELYKHYEFMLPEVNSAVKRAVHEVNNVPSTPIKVKFKRVQPVRTLSF